MRKVDNRERKGGGGGGNNNKNSDHYVVDNEIRSPCGALLMHSLV